MQDKSVLEEGGIRPSDDVEASEGLRQHEFHDFADIARHGVLLKILPCPIFLRRIPVSRQTVFAEMSAFAGI